MTNPVHEENGKWYFWDETEGSRCGPFNSEEIAEKELSQYCATFLAPKDTRIKHCGTCKFWELNGNDEGTCTCEFMNNTDPPIGGIASLGAIRTHAVFGCTNHR